MSPWYKRAGVYADFLGSSRFFVSVSENFCFAGGDLKLCPRSNFTFVFLLHFFFCFWVLFSCHFHFSFFYLTVGLSITYLLSYVFMKISVHFRNFFCKIFGKFRVIAIGHHTALFTQQCSECERQVS